MQMLEDTCMHTAATSNTEGVIQGVLIDKDAAKSTASFRDYCFIFRHTYMYRENYEPISHIAPFPPRPQDVQGNEQQTNGSSDDQDSGNDDGGEHEGNRSTEDEDDGRVGGREDDVSEYDQPGNENCQDWGDYDLSLGELTKVEWDTMDDDAKDDYLS